MVFETFDPLGICASDLVLLLQISHALQTTIFSVSDIQLFGECNCQNKSMLKCKMRKFNNCSWPLRSLSFLQTSRLLQVTPPHWQPLCAIITHTQKSDARMWSDTLLRVYPHRHKHVHNLSPSVTPRPSRGPGQPQQAFSNVSKTPELGSTPRVR